MRTSVVTEKYQQQLVPEAALLERRRHILHALVQKRTHAEVALALLRAYRRRLRAVGRKCSGVSTRNLQGSMGILKREVVEERPRVSPSLPNDLYGLRGEDIPVCMRSNDLDGRIQGSSLRCRFTHCSGREAGRNPQRDHPPSRSQPRSPSIPRHLHRRCHQPPPARQ